MSIPQNDKETKVEYKNRLARLSVIDGANPLAPLNQGIIETYQQKEHITQQMVTTIKQSAIQSDSKVQMANLCVVAANKINGVAALHTDILKREVLATFYQLYPEKFQNKTNGVTPRRWLAWCNPAMSKVITKWLGNDDWLKELKLLEELKKHAEDPRLQKEFHEAKVYNKKKLSEYLKNMTGFDVPVNAIFDIQIKRIHEYKRQLLNLMGIVYRYKKIKEMTPDERRNLPPKVCIFGGKAFITYHQAKRIVHLIGIVANVINLDPVCKDLLKVFFVPNYNVKVAEHLIPAADICHQISTAGLEASGTSNMKFQMNGCVTIGTLDGANVEILDLVGPENFFLFGATTDQIPEIRQQRRNGNFIPDPRLTECMDWIRSGVFNAKNDHEICQTIECVLGSLEGNEGFGVGDYFCVGNDFPSFIDAIAKADEAYTTQDRWLRMSIIQTAMSGKFSSDRTIDQYSTEIWKISSSPCEKI